MKHYRSEAKNLPGLKGIAILFVFMSAAVAIAEPRIACRNPSFSFGENYGSDIIEHAFTILNDGSEPLEIKDLRACCGGNMTISSKIIPAGSNATCLVSLSPKGRSGSQNKSFYISSTDPRQPYFQLELKGVLVVPVSLDPQSVDFGVVKAGHATNLDFSVNCASNVTLMITNAVLDNASFRVTYEKSNLQVPGGRDAAGSWKVSVRTVPPMPAGVTRGILHLYTDNQQYRNIEVNVSATVSGDLVVVPREIMLSLPGGAPSPVLRYIALKSRTGKPFKIINIDVPEVNIAVESVPVQSGGYRITLRNIIPFEDLNGRSLLIMTDHEEVKKVEIPFKVSDPRAVGLIP